jgi:hypothetical protein
LLDRPVYAQLLLGASFLIASYQDVKNRAVSDLAWIPAVAGTVYIFYYDFTVTTAALELEVARVALVGGIAFAFAFFGGIGEADAIAIAFVAADPYPFSPIPALFAGGAVALAHIGYEYIVGNAKGGQVIPIEKFLKEQRWIPKALIKDGVKIEVNRDVNLAREEVEAKQSPGAMVEVSYGVPTAAYLGVGYAAFLIYLVVFNLTAFMALP